MRVATVLVLALAVIAVGCHKQAPAQQQTPVVAQAASPRTLTVPVVLTRQFFQPSSLALHTGDTVTLQITAPDQSHVVSIPALGLQTTVPAGGAGSLSFTVGKPGSMTVMCGDNCDADVNLAISVT